MASSSLSRLRSLFSATSLPKPTATSPPKPTATSSLKPTATSPSKPAATSSFQSMVKSFKKSCRSDRFRRQHVTAYVATVRRLAAAEQFSLIEEIIEHQKKYKEISTEGFTLRLLSLYGKSGMFGHAQKLFDEMPLLKCDRTVKSFNALLSACVNAKEFDKISEIFAHVPEKLSIIPNVVSYNTVVKAFCEMGSLDSAFSVIEEMEKNELVPNEITFNTLLEAFYSNNRFSDAEKVWEMMREKNVVPNCRSYNPKLRALVASERISEAVELIEEMKRVEVEPDSFSYNALIKGFCESGNMEEAKRCLGEMTKNGCKTDRVTYVLIGYLACKTGDFDYAFELCKEAINQKLVIHKALAQLVVDGLVKVSKIEEAKELVELGNSNNYFTYNLNMPETG